MSPQQQQRVTSIVPWIALVVTIVGFAGKLYSDSEVQKASVEIIMKKLDKIEQKMDNQAERIARLEK